MASHNDNIDQFDQPLDEHHHDHIDTHIPLHCQIQKVLLLTNKFKHNCTKSAIALDVWIQHNKLTEVKEEATEIQRIIRSDLHKIIDLTSLCKTEASKLIAKNEKLKNENNGLKDEISRLRKQNEDCLKLFDTPMEEKNETDTPMEEKNQTDKE